MKVHVVFSLNVICSSDDIIRVVIRDGPLEITGGGGGEKFSVHEFCFKPTCLQDFFF